MLNRTESNTRHEKSEARQKIKMSAELELNGKSVDEGGNEQPTDDGECGQKPADGVRSHQDVTGNAEAVVKRRGRPSKKTNATKESNGKIDRYFLRGKTEEEKTIFMSREKVPSKT